MASSLGPLDWVLRVYSTATNRSDPSRAPWYRGRGNVKTQSGTRDARIGRSTPSYRSCGGRSALADDRYMIRSRGGSGEIEGDLPRLAGRRADLLLCPRLPLAPTRRGCARCAASSTRGLSDAGPAHGDAMAAMDDRALLLRELLEPVEQDLGTVITTCDTTGRSTRRHAGALTPEGLGAHRTAHGRAPPNT